MANILINTACCSATCDTVTNPCTCPGQPVVQYTEKEACGIISPKSCFLDSFIPVGNGSPIIYYKNKSTTTTVTSNLDYHAENVVVPGFGLLEYNDHTLSYTSSSTQLEAISGGGQTLNEDCSVTQANCSTVNSCLGGSISISETFSFKAAEWINNTPYIYDYVSTTSGTAVGDGNGNCQWVGSRNYTETVTVDGETTTTSGSDDYVREPSPSFCPGNCVTTTNVTQDSDFYSISGSISDSYTETWTNPYIPEETIEGQVTQSESYSEIISQNLLVEVQCNPEGLPQDVANCNYDNYADWGAPSSIAPINGDDPSPPTFEPICIHVQDQTVINPTTCAFCLGEGKLTWTEQIQEGYQIEITLCFTNFNDPPCEGGTTYTLTSDLTEITFNLPDFQQEEIQGNPVANVVVICITNAVYSQITGP
jgi:hypothetical protein